MGIQANTGCHKERGAGGLKCRRLSRQDQKQKHLIEKKKNLDTEKQANRADDSAKSELKTGLKYKVNSIEGTRCN